MSSYRAANSRTSLSISQNFLTGSKTIARLMKLSGLSAADTVVEIGAGKGHLTRALASRCAAVLAWELDAAYARRLQAQFGASPAVRVLHADFLQARLPREPYKVFANIPFSITTAILTKLTRGPSLPEEMFLVMEKGAAKRFLGQPRETAHSLALKPLYTARIAYHFAREDFHPAPRVDVVLVHFQKKQQPDLPFHRVTAFRAFVERGLREGLHGRNAALTRAQISRALKAEGLMDLPQSGEMLYVQWLCLFRCVERMGPRR